MKKSLLFGALLSCTFSGICPPIHAQPLPAQNFAPIQEQPLPAQNAEAKSGYDLFLEARALIKDGPNGEPLATEKLAPAENLRLQRLGTTRNAPALAKLREALKMYIVFPAFDDATPDSHLDSISAVRLFARHLAQESAVRAADGDALGAAQSSLDVLDLSTQAARGPIINALVGAATESIARKSLLQNASGLNAGQAREVAAKWEKISDYFPTYAQTLRDEEQLNLRLTYQNIAADFVKRNNPVAIAQAEAELKKAGENGEMTEQEWKEAKESLALSKNLTFADINAETRAIFDEALLRANQPYSVVKTQAPIAANNPIAAPTTELISAASTRFYAERNIVDNRQLIAALRLRADKLESGQYPAIFDAGIDPFSPDLSPLKYKRAGDSYVLYSVGPDGKDDDGGEIQTLQTNDETGAKSVSDRLAPDSTGDIVAPVL